MFTWVGCVTLTVTVADVLTASVTVTVYIVPAHKPVIAPVVALIAPDGTVGEIL
jgi:hypothetical protein